MLRPGVVNRYIQGVVNLYVQGLWMFTSRVLTFRCYKSLRAGVRTQIPTSHSRQISQAIYIRFLFNSFIVLSLHMGLCPDADIDPNFSMRQKDFAGSFRRIRTECPKNTSFTETLLRYASHVIVFYGTPGKLEKKKKSHFCQNTRENSRLPS